MMLKITGMLLLLFCTVSQAVEPSAPLANDGLHDTENPSFPLLQEPADALTNLPVDINGMTDWVKSLQHGHITPRSDVAGGSKMKVVDLDITMKNTASMPYVMFSHKVHTQWLTCSNCHSRIFLPQVGGNFVTMSKIMAGEYCGVCHGKVAFTTLDCDRCHNTPNAKQGLR